MLSTDTVKVNIKIGYYFVIQSGLKNWWGKYFDFT